MTTDAQRLTTLLERLERAGRPVDYHKHKLVSSCWVLRFPDGGDLNIRELDGFPDRDRATLLGWAVQQIGAEGFSRDVETLVGKVRVDAWKVVNGKDVDICTDAPTELEATLQALAEILESKNA